MRIPVPWPQLWLGESRRTIPRTSVQPRPGHRWASHRSYAAEWPFHKPSCLSGAL